MRNRIGLFFVNIAYYAVGAYAPTLLLNKSCVPPKNDSVKHPSINSKSIVGIIYIS